VSGFPIVGTGAVTPAGCGVDALWQACLAGQPIPTAPVDHFDCAGIEQYQVALVPPVPGLAPRSAPRRWSDLAVMAARQAMTEAEAHSVPRRRPTALVIGSTDSTGYEHDQTGRGRCSARAVAERLEIDGPAMMAANASAAGAAALAIAVDLLQAQVADRVVVVGVDCITRSGQFGLAALRALSREGCHPFTAHRRGIHLAEAAAAMVIDRIAPDAGTRLFGAHVSNVATQYARPDVAGIIDAVAGALFSAGVDADDIDHVSAHAAGTAQGDRAEMAALGELFKARMTEVPVFSAKGVTGHCQGAAGVLEAIVAKLAIEVGRAPVQGELDAVDPAWSDQNFGHLSYPRPLRYATSISCGLGGCNAAVVVGAA
jgi:3-oxoacyl-(acyl-carrier-protein) synthase